MYEFKFDVEFHNVPSLADITLGDLYLHFLNALSVFSSQLKQMSFSLTKVSSLRAIMIYVLLICQFCKNVLLWQGYLCLCPTFLSCSYTMHLVFQNLLMFCNWRYYIPKMLTFFPQCPLIEAWPLMHTSKLNVAYVHGYKKKILII